MAETGGSPPDDFNKSTDMADERVTVDPAIVQRASDAIEQQNQVAAAEREIAELKNKLALKKLADERAKLMEELNGGGSSNPTVAASPAVQQIKEEKPKGRGRPKKRDATAAEVSIFIATADKVCCLCNQTDFSFFSADGGRGSSEKASNQACDQAG